MSWAQTGYDEIENNASKYDGGSGGGGGGNQIRQFWTPIGATKRIVVLDDNPFGFWQHSLWSIGVKGDKPICLDRNGNLAQTHGACPFCEQAELNRKTKGAEGHKLWPSYVGYVTVIDCGEVKNSPTGQYLEGWVNDQGREFNFDRKLLPLNRGGKDKPGLLHKFRRFREKKQGTLVGAVFDLYRGGQKEERPGTEWEFVGRVDVSTVEALRESLRSLDGVRPDKHNALIEENVNDNGVIDYMTHFQPRNRAQLMAMLPNTGASQGWGQQASPPPAQASPPPAQSAGAQMPYTDDDIPF